MQRFLTHLALVVIGIKGWPMPIKRDLEATLIKFRQSIKFPAEINPGRHQRRSKLCVTSGRAEIKNFLPCRVNAVR